MVAAGEEKGGLVMRRGFSKSSHPLLLIAASRWSSPEWHNPPVRAAAAAGILRGAVAAWASFWVPERDGCHRVWVRAPIPVLPSGILGSIFQDRK